MKNLDFNELSKRKLNDAEMRSIKGGRSGTIVGCRTYGGVCYIDIQWHDTGKTDCDQERPMQQCDVCAAAYALY